MGEETKELKGQGGQEDGKIELSLLKDNPQVRKRKPLPESEDRVARRGLSGRSCDLPSRDAVDLN